MKKEEIKFCKVCGREVPRLIQGMCYKHYSQWLKFGKVLDTNPRTVGDDNEIRTYEDYGEIDTYDKYGNVIATFKFDLEDLKYLIGHKWRIRFNKKNGEGKPYLVTGHTIFFHRLIMGNPNTEIDHINRDTCDNRKCNLRESFRTQQLGNTSLRIDNVQGLKGVYWVEKYQYYRAEINIYNKHFFSKGFKTKAEAAYMRYLYEQHFYKTIGIYNTEEMNHLINTLTEEQKKDIQKYFANRMKVQVEKI